jgi:hypothetical protein
MRFSYVKNKKNIEYKGSKKKISIFVFSFFYIFF